jgi:phytoene/squalene synthetase
MDARFAPAITKAASKQTYYTIRFLVDRPRVANAYRAYAYFRWVDDVLDAESPLDPTSIQDAAAVRTRFLARQKALLDECLLGEPPPAANPHEAMLIDLVRSADLADGGLETYLRHMMLVMDFDVRRRGRLVSKAELDDYTRWLAVAVTEAMHHFIGNGAAAPHDDTRYAAVSGAHILHMLRDTYTDLRAGYFNVPREVLAAHSIGPEDVGSDAYRAWVEGRVLLAAAQFETGRAYFARVENRRHRLAGLAYMARFEWLIETLMREDFKLPPRYNKQDRLVAGPGRGMHAIAWIIDSWRVHTLPTPFASPRTGEP